MMYLADYHVHSNCSPDSVESMVALAQAAIDHGLQELCITDHVDTRYWEVWTPREHDWSIAVEEFRLVQEAMGDRIRLRFGAELGEVTRDFARMDRFLEAAPALDFVIGSMHTTAGRHGWQDLYYLDNPDPDYNRDLIGGYLEEVKKLVDWGRFHVLGHLTLPLRYINTKVGLQMTFEGFEEQVDAIFRTLIENGQGIEINTNRGSEPLPGARELRRYRELGGEIITLGSDAHSARHVGCAIREGQQLLKECGFDYFCTYTGGKPEFRKL